MTTLIDLLKTTRQYFWQKDFDEVEVNYLNSSLPLESNLYSFPVKNWYLPTSPEFALKQYLAQNPHDCFSIAHCFRDLESTGPHHLPEFLMLEYYLVNKNLTDLQESLKDYLSHFLKLDFIDYRLPSDLPDNEPDFNQFFLNEVEPTLPKDKAIFITGYPAFLSPLAEPNHRFELYVNGIEIANGCQENRHSEQIMTAFESEKKYRQSHHLPSHPISTDFAKICSLLPPCSGVGIGLDRLLMVINHQNHL